MRSLPSCNAASSCTNSTVLVIHGTHRTSIHRHPRSTNRSTATLNTTAIQATERNHGGRSMGRLRTQLALPRLVVPRPEVPRYIPYDDSDELDA